MELFGYTPTAPKVKPIEYLRYYLRARWRVLNDTTRGILRRRFARTNVP
jgi:hypothetical protein